MKLSEGELSAASTDELNEMLTKALEEEAYERASRIRDELNKRKSNRSAFMKMKKQPGQAAFISGSGSVTDFGNGTRFSACT